MLSNVYCMIGNDVSDLDDYNYKSILDETLQYIRNGVENIEIVGINTRDFRKLIKDIRKNKLVYYKLRITDLMCEVNRSLVYYELEAIYKNED